MNTIVRKIMNLLLKGKGDSEAYIKHLRKIGVKVGNNVIIYSPYKCDIDEQNPHMLEIGDNVKILAGTTILTHDFSWCVSRLYFLLTVIGSPPLARGILYPELLEARRTRITPACAGNTIYNNCIRRVLRDHPRLRGEYSYEND